MGKVKKNTPPYKLEDDTEPVMENSSKTGCFISRSIAAKRKKDLFQNPTQKEMEAIERADKMRQMPEKEKGIKEQKVIFNSSVGKGVQLSPKAHQVLAGLVELICSEGGEDIEEYCEALEQPKTTTELTKEGLKDIVRTFDLDKLCKFLYNGRNDEQRRTEALSSLWSLHFTPCAFFYRYEWATDNGKRARTWREITPFIYVLYSDPPQEENEVAGKYEQQSEENGKAVKKREEHVPTNGSVKITFSRPFFQGLKHNFAYIQENAHSEMSRRGSGAEKEIYYIMLSLLQELQFKKRVSADKAERKARATGERKKLPLNVIEKMAEEARRKELLCTFKIDSLLERLTHDTYTDHRRWDRLEEDINHCIDSYKRSGAIFEGSIEKEGKGKPKSVTFVISPGKRKEAAPTLPGMGVIDVPADCVKEVRSE